MKERIRTSANQASALDRAKERMRFFRLEEELLESEQCLQILVEELGDCAFYRLDPRGHVASWNSAAEQMEGYRASEILGQHMACFYPEGKSCAAQVQERLKIAAIQGRFQEETWRLRKNGCRYWAHVVIRTLPGRNGQLRGFLKILSDHTQQKKAEKNIQRLYRDFEHQVCERTAQLEAAHRELEEISDSVAHNVREPLRKIHEFVAVLQRNATAKLDKKSQSYLESISESTIQTKQWIDDLLIFFRMGHAEMYKWRFSFDHILQEILRDLRQETQGRNIEWVIGKLPEVHGDSVMLWLVLINLVSNALKHTRTRTKARIEINCTPTCSEFIFYIRDNGVGFDMQQADMLFRVFPPTNTPLPFREMQAGLANVRRIIQRHGGRTWAEGTIDKGATFYFSLPRSSEDQPAHPPSKPSALHEKSGLWEPSLEPPLPPITKEDGHP